jgi:hypothetical protein
VLAIPTPKEVPTRNFFAPLRTTNMETESSRLEASSEEEATPQKMYRSLPIILKTPTTLIQLHRQLKNVTKDDFEFSSTRNGTRVVTKSMEDFKAVKSHFSNSNLSYYSFFPKFQKPVKVVIRYLSPNNPAEDISDGLVNWGLT